jgi:hypothetical protein
MRVSVPARATPLAEGRPREREGWDGEPSCRAAEPSLADREAQRATACHLRDERGVGVSPRSYCRLHRSGQGNIDALLFKQGRRSPRADSRDATHSVERNDHAGLAAEALRVREGQIVARHEDAAAKHSLTAHQGDDRPDRINPPGGRGWARQTTFANAA